MGSVRSHGGYVLIEENLPGCSLEPCPVHGWGCCVNGCVSVTQGDQLTVVITLGGKSNGMKQKPSRFYFSLIHRSYLDKIVYDYDESLSLFGNKVIFIFRLLL